jgi:predicted dehydrogenase
MRRRYFLPTLAAATTRFATAASDKVHLAIIGVRGRGRALAGAFAKLDDASIDCLVDVDERVIGPTADLVEKAGKKRPRAEGDMRRVFDDKNIDAVVIATPDHWHTPAAILACEAGKDVYLEKPCSHNLRESKLLLAAVRKHKRIVQHGTQSRSREITREAIQYCHSGRIGKVVMAKAWDVQKRDDIGHKADSHTPMGVDYDTWIGPAPALPFNENRFHYTWHWHWNFGTGDAGNDGAHQIDMARWALEVDLPTEASGTGAKLFFDDDQQTPDTINATFRYPGKMLMFEMRIWNPYAMEGVENGVAVYGGDGMVHIGKWDRQWGYKVFDAKGKMVKHEQGQGEDEAHLRNFIDCVRSRKAPNAEIEIGIRSVAHCHLANLVARTGRTVRFDPATGLAIGDSDIVKMNGREYRAHWSRPHGA